MNALVGHKAAKAAIVLFVCSLYIVIGCLPYTSVEYFPNYVVRDATSDALIFERPGIAYMRSTPEWLSSPSEINEAVVDLLVRASTINQDGPARIFTVSQNSSSRNLTVGQSMTDLVIRLRRSPATPNGTPAFEVPGVFEVGAVVRITVSISDTRLEVSVDGQRRLSEPLSSSPFGFWSPDYRLALGNEMTFDRPWLGAIERAVVSVNGVSYDHLSDLSLGAFGRYYLPRDLYPARFAWQLPLVVDWVVNFVGFLPLGMLVAVMVSARGLALLSAGLLSAAVSAAVELTQMWLPWRFPGLSDVVLNLSGGALGALLLMMVTARYRFVTNSVVFRFLREGDRISPGAN